MSKAIAKRDRNEVAQTTNGIKYERNADWVVCDVSGSMEAYLPNTHKRRIDCLNEAIAQMGTDVQVLAFSSHVIHTTERQFSSQSDTLLIPALELVAQYEPSYIVIVSDGEINDDHERNLALVEQIAQTAIVDTLFIGPSSSTAAIEFMRELARRGNGRARVYDLTAPANQRLVETMQKFLPAPDEAIKV